MDLKRFFRTAPCAVLATAALVVSACDDDRPRGARRIDDGRLLLGGSDAVGGVGDFYLSNGIVEAVIDGAGPQADPPGLEPSLVDLGIEVPRQNSAGPSGGYLVDLGLVGRGNDQFAQMLQVVGIDSAQVPTYETIETGDDGGTPFVRAVGTVPFDPDGPGPLERVTAPISTEYRADAGLPRLTLRSVVGNPGPAPALLVNFFDAVIWTLKGPLPFSPALGRGFHHHVLPDFTQPQALVPGFEFVPYVVATGVLDERDGAVDDRTLEPTGGVCYAIVLGGAEVDADGDGPLPALPAPGLPTLFGLNNVTTSAVGFGGPNVLLPGSTFAYTRHLFVGGRNEVAACTDLVFDHFGLPTVEVSGRIADARGRGVEASVIFTVGEVSPLETVAPGAPLTQARSSETGEFALRLPPGVYTAHVTASERPEVTASVSIPPAGPVSIDLPPMAVPGTIAVDVRVDGRRWPARVSFLPVDGEEPAIGRLHDVFTFDTSRPGACAGDPTLSCTSDEACAWAAPCVRVCSTNPAVRCSGDADCIVPGQCVAGVDEHPESFGGGPAQGSTLYTRDGRGSVAIRPGTYRVLATRGIEYTIDERVVTVGEGEVRTVSLAIARAVETPNALSADFHIHSARSFDSGAPLEDRVLSFAAEGVEVMISSDHDFHVDYEPVIETLGLRRRIASIPGNEVTTGSPPPVPNELKFGHLNGFPVPILPDARRRGAIEDEFVFPNWIYDRLRAQGARVIQINHPRAPLEQGGTGIGYFNNMGFEPTRAVTDEANAFLLDDLVSFDSDVRNPRGTRNVDFDVIEVANGNRPDKFLSYLGARRDWVSLMLQGLPGEPRGLFKPATGVSDSHRLTIELPGYARTLVFGVGAKPRRLRRDRFYDAVLEGRMVVTTGPILEVDVRGAGPGETIGVLGGAVPLDVRVDAASWIPVDEVRVVVNGVVERTFTLDSFSQNPRFDETISLALDRDAAVFVEAGPSLPDEPGVSVPPSAGYSDVVDDGVAYGFTNPIFIDVDGGGFTPPGLPDCEVSPGAIVCAPLGRIEADLSHARAAPSFLSRLYVPETILRELLP